MANEYGGEMGKDYGKDGMKPDAGAEGGEMKYGEEHLTKEQADAIAHQAAGKEGYDDPNAEDPTSKGVGGEPAGNKK